MPSRDFLWIGLAKVCSLLVVSLLLMILGFLLSESLPALRDIGISRFLTDDTWHPLSSDYGMFPMLVATILTSLGALLLAGPLGIGMAVLIQFYAPPFLSVSLQRLLEIMGGIPSVVYGLWGIAVVAPAISYWGGSGQNLLTATLILAMMILPTVALVAQSSLAAVPHQQLRAAVALGLGRSAIVRRIVLPVAWPGLMTGAVLALCRALGETMAVVMVAGNVPELPDSALSPVRTLNANIALELGYASSEHRSILFVSGLLVLLVVAGLLFGARERSNV